MNPEIYNYTVKNNLCLFQKGPLSQWWGGFCYQKGGFETPITYGSKWTRATNRYYNCAEQWMMAQKAALFDDEETFEKIMLEKNPAQHKALGRLIKNFQPDLWDLAKFDIVCKGNFLKFDQNEELDRFLNSFNEFTIFAEAAPWDSIWGIGLGPKDPDALDIHKWKGQNLLGKAIMRIRTNTYDY